MAMPMISNNTAIIFNLSDTFDYDAYCRECKNQDFEPDNLGVFLQKAGLVFGAKKRNPTDPLQAYSEILQVMNAAFTLPQKDASTQIVIHNNRKGCCGGGKVR